MGNEEDAPVGQLTPDQIRSIAWTVIMEHNRIGRAIREPPYQGDGKNLQLARENALPMVCKIIEMAAQAPYLPDK